MQLDPGDRCGISNGGWPPLTIVRDTDGHYFTERLSSNLKEYIRDEINEQDAMLWIQSDD